MKQLCIIFSMMLISHGSFAQQKSNNPMRLRLDEYDITLPEGKVHFRIDTTKFLLIYPPSYSKTELKDYLQKLSIFNQINDTDFINYPKAVIVDPKISSTYDQTYQDIQTQLPNFTVSPMLLYKNIRQAIYNKFFVKISSSQKQLLENYAQELHFTTEESKLENIYWCTSENSTFNSFELARFLQSEEIFDIVEPDFIYFCQLSTNDTYYSNQWAIQNTGQYSGTPGADMKVSQAWNTTIGSQSISVGILDCFGSVANFSHPDIPFYTSYDATGTGFTSSGFAGDAHGIGCASIVSATANNIIGMAGIAYNSVVKAIKIGSISNSSGNWTGTGNSISNGIIWGYQNCSILSNSNSFGSSSSLVNTAITNSTTTGRAGLGTPFFSSAGNDNLNTISYPSSFANSIAVAASTMCDTRKSTSSCDGNTTWGSNYGVGVDVAAPGVTIIACDLTGSAGYVSGDYMLFSGTSAACPAAAAVMALILSANPGISYTNARYAMESTCDKVGGYGYSTVGAQPNGTWSNDLGYGRVNALNAVLSVSPSCSGTTTLTNCTGTITDGSGSNNYANNLNCSWLIQVAGAGSIKINFTSINTESGNDIIYVHNGTSAAAPLLGSFSGTTLPPTLFSSGNAMFIRFVTNSANVLQGWSLNYQCCSINFANAGPDINLNCTSTNGVIGTNAIAGYSYSWLPISGLSSSINAQPLASPTATTTYTLTVTNSLGCISTDIVIVHVNNTPIVANAGPNKFVTCLLPSATIGQTTAGAVTYAWSPTTALNNTSIAQPIASPLVTTAYTVTVTGSNGCTSTSSVVVTSTKTPPIANAGADYTISMSNPAAPLGVPPVAGNTYSWLPMAGLSSTTISNPTASPSWQTTYTVTVTGSNGCTATDIVDINSIQEFDAMIDQDISCYGFSDGSCIASPIAPTVFTTYTLDNTISNSTGYFQGISQGTHSVCASNGSYTQCQTLTFTEPTPLTATISIVSPITCTNNTGTLLGDAQGGTASSYDVYWTNSANTILIYDYILDNQPAGTYTFHAYDGHGCSITSNATLVNPVSCGLTLNLTCYIQGYMNSGITMQAALYNQLQPNSLSDCDTIQIELHSINAPFQLVYTTKAVLHTNGTATCNFSSASPDSYYVVIKHRNAIQTWSANPVTIGTSPLSYNFSTAANKAFGSNQVLVSSGKYALYSGDLNNDENIDLLDLLIAETDINNFQYGYLASDMNGDGNVDLLDSPVIESNTNNFIFSAHP